MRRTLASIALISMLTGWLGAAPVNPLDQIGYDQPNAAQAVHRTVGHAELFAASASNAGPAALDAVGEGGLPALPSLANLPREQRKYLLSLQDASGAIAQTPSQQQVIPYFSNMAALAMLSFRDGRVAVRQYLEWYVTHINERDRFGLKGTIYDYVRQGDTWVATEDYDSADSYAATFLSLVAAYGAASGDLSFARQRQAELQAVADVLLALQDKDGLMWAKPRYYVKFLMDNAENYRGLLDGAELMRQLGQVVLAERYQVAAEQVAAGIERRLWIPEGQAYAWALYGRWWARQPRERWYPDTVAQLFPIVFGVVPPDGERAQTLYGYLNQKYPNWVAGEFDDRFPWAILALVAATMQDKERAVAYLDNVNQQVFAPSQGATYPWYAGESAFLLKAWRFLWPEMPVWANVDIDDEDAQAESAPPDEQEDPVAASPGKQR